MTKIKPIIDKNAPYEERCPICKALIISRARCPQSNSECENGHKWYYLGKEIIIDKGWESFAGMNINLIMKKWNWKNFDVGDVTPVNLPYG